MSSKIKIYVTYGNGSNLAQAFSVVEGDSLDECYKRIRAVTQSKYAFTYTEEQFMPQIERFGLHEVPLQAQVTL